MGSYSNTCDIQHNDGEAVVGSVGEDRKRYYVTRHTMALLSALNGLAYQELGFHLSINDASLSHGGFFDKGTDNREEHCHVSHQKGIDFDVNTGKRWWIDRRTGEIVKRTDDNKYDVELYFPDCVEEHTDSLNCLVPFGVKGIPVPRREILDRLANRVGLEKIEEDTLHYRSPY